MFTAAWTAGGDRHERGLVARVEPSSHSIFFTQDVALEARVMRAMAGYGVLVPDILWEEPDASWLGAPFIVMSRVDGVIPTDNPPYTFGGWLLGSTPEEQASVFTTGLDAMAAVHRIPIEPLSFLARPVGEPGADAEVAYLRDYTERVCGDQRHKTLDAGIDWLDEHRPATEPIRVCWGDSRIGNKIFAGHRCAALLDWEMATIGNPEMDLAWFLYFDRLFSEGLQAPRPAGFPSKQDALGHYEDLTGITPRNVEYYEVMASAKFAAIMVRLGQLMVWSGVLPEDTDFGANSFAMQFLGVLLDERAAATGA
jgi:aminoglycoside phosphotransferase (APT) family kinase protein